MDYLVIGGIAVATYMLFKALKKPASGTGGSTDGNTGGNTGGASLPACAQNLLPNGFPKSSWTPSPAMDYQGVALNTNKQITLGTTGYEVLAIQMWTNKGNTNVLALDGVYGPATMAAYKAELIRTNADQSKIDSVNNFKFSDHRGITYVNPLRNQKTLTTSIIPNCPSLKTFMFGAYDLEGSTMDATPNVQ